MLIDDRAGCVEKCDVFSQHDWRHAGSLKRCCHSLSLSDTDRMI